MKKILDDSVPSYGKWARPGEEMQFTIRRVIPDYHISVLGLPRGATFDPLTLTFKWTPSPLQVGTHVVLVRISLGGKSMERSLKIEVWGESDSYLYPGFRSAFLIPRNLDAHGLHYGLAFLITGYSWIKRNSSSGPSHGRLYAFLENLESVKENTGYTLHYGVGVELSLEKNPRRYFAIPTFGLEIGGSYSSRITTACSDGRCNDRAGGDFVFTPTFGIILYNRSELWITLGAGYHIPVREWNDFRGFKFTAGVHYGMW